MALHPRRLQDVPTGTKTVMSSSSSGSDGGGGIGCVEGTMMVDMGGKDVVNVSTPSTLASGANVLMPPEVGVSTAGFSAEWQPSVQPCNSLQSPQSICSTERSPYSNCHKRIKVQYWSISIGAA